MTLVIVRTLEEYIYKLLCNSFKEEVNENPIQKNLPSDHDGGIEVMNVEENRYLLHHGVVGS